MTLFIDRACSADAHFTLDDQTAPAVARLVTRLDGMPLAADDRELTAGQARVLIFVNQQNTRAGTSQTSYGDAMLAVSAVFQSGRWRSRTSTRSPDDLTNAAVRSE